MGCSNTISLNYISGNKGTKVVDFWGNPNFAPNEDGFYEGAGLMSQERSNDQLSWERLRELWRTRQQIKREEKLNNESLRDEMKIRKKLLNPKLVPLEILK